MYYVVLAIHVIVCIVLILVVLLQAGRGGGFSDMLGGGQPQSLFGTQTNAFMVRVTEVCAVVFIITSLSLAMMSTQRGKSLMSSQRLVQQAQGQVPVIPQPPQAPQQVLPQVPAAAPAAQPANVPAAEVPAETPA